MDRSGNGSQKTQQVHYRTTFDYGQTALVYKSEDVSIPAEYTRSFPVEHVRYYTNQTQQRYPNNMDFAAPQDGGTYLPFQQIQIPSSSNPNELYDGFSSNMEFVNRGAVGTPMYPLREDDRVEEHTPSGMHLSNTREWKPYFVEATPELPGEEESHETGSGRSGQGFPGMVRSETSQSSQSSLRPSMLATSSLSQESSATSLDMPKAADEGTYAHSKDHRERNRIAARRCRQKAKQGISQLQQRESDLHEQNKALRCYAASLKEEVLRLKMEILRHSNCDSSMIQEYIANAARR
ncbi:hypothetical protein GGS20DRAFT_340052 [Poronia punctata]|nr:hypothetical protein GGS20DRAFT_340052 [Poronia punctata]